MCTQRNVLPAKRYLLHSRLLACVLIPLKGQILNETCNQDCYANFSVPSFPRTHIIFHLEGTCFSPTYYTLQGPKKCTTTLIYA